MTEYEMIKEIKSIIVRHHKGLGCEVLCDGDQCENCEFTAEDIYNANYRKVGDDEIVIKKADYEALCEIANDMSNGLIRWATNLEQTSWELRRKGLLSR